MFDKELVLEILTQVYRSTQMVIKRFEPIKSADEFTNSDSGLEKLDAICMQLISIGESLKNLDKITDSSLLSRYPQVDWKKVKGLRDIITHHYFDLDAEAIYNVCENHIDDLATMINKMIKELDKIT